MDMPAIVACKENNFEDGSQNLCPFLEHDPVVPKYYNFRDQQTTASPSRKIEYQKICPGLTVVGNVIKIVLKSMIYRI